MMAAIELIAFAKIREVSNMDNLMVYQIYQCSYIDLNHVSALSIEVHFALLQCVVRIPNGRSHSGLSIDRFISSTFCLQLI